MEILSLNEVPDHISNLEGPLLLSLDCDGLDSSFMPAVSAPNHNGLTKKEYESLLTELKKYWSRTSNKPYYGIYEYNPVFDDLSLSSGRYLAHTIYKLTT